jgi:hypothetical protein
MKWAYNMAFQRRIICVCISFGCDFMLKKRYENFKKCVKSLNLDMNLWTKYEQI